MNTDRETNDTPKGDLRSRFRGPLLRLGDEGYREARAAWNLNAQQWPAAVDAVVEALLDHPAIPALAADDPGGRST